MKKFSLFLLFFTAVVNLSGCTAQVKNNDTTTQSSPAYQKLNGNWEGVLNLKSSASETLGIRIILGNSGVKLFHQNSKSGAWSEAMPGLFEITRKDGNAVLNATDSGSDSEGTWVETWALVASYRSHDELQVEWVRLVNNIDLPVSDSRKTFSEGAAGILKRVNLAN